jgi:hypothetical protein
MTMKRLPALLLAALTGAALLALTGLALGPADDGAASARSATYTAPDKSFTIALPTGWRAVAHGAGGTVLRRSTGEATLVVRRHGALTQSYSQLGKKLVKTLERKLDGDVKTLQAARVPVGNGDGLLVSFLRPSTARVQSIVVTPAGAASYTLDLVAAADDAAVAREQGAMVRSFTPAL